MKALAAVLATLLLVAICSSTASSPQLDTATQCCFRHTKVFIRPRRIASAYRTSSSCSLPAVVVVTKSGKEVCVDPEALWVQNYLRNINNLKE